MQWLFGIPLLLALAVVSNASIAQELGCDSPQSAFECHNVSWEKEQWASLFSVLAPGYRDYLIFEARFAMGVGAKGDEADAILAKYVDETKFEKLAATFKRRPTTEQTHEIFSQSIKDKKGMFVDCQKYFAKRNPDRPYPKFGPLVKLVIIKDVASAKTTVTSTIVHWSNAGGDAKDIRHETETTSDIFVYFIKSNGKWFYATKTEWQQKTNKGENK